MANAFFFSGPFRFTTCGAHILRVRRAVFQRPTFLAKHSIVKIGNGTETSKPVRFLTKGLTWLAKSTSMPDQNGTSGLRVMSAGSYD